MIRRMAVLGGLAAVGVVIHHATYWVVTAMIWWTDQYRPTTVPDLAWVGTPGHLALVAVDIVALAAVPAFLFISGYFIAASTPRASRTVSWGTIVTRVKTLLPPYLFWSLVIIFMAGVQGVVPSLTQVAHDLLTGGATGPYYYVPMVIQMFLLSPLLVPIARIRWRGLLVTTAIIQLGISLLRTAAVVLGPGAIGGGTAVGALLGWNLLANCFWFPLGMVTEFHPEVFKRIQRTIGKPVTLTVGVALVFMITFAGRLLLMQISGRHWIAGPLFLENFLFLVVLLAYFAMAEIRPSLSPVLVSLGGMAYGIYLVNAVALEVTSRLAYHIAPRLLGSQFLFMVVLVLAGVGMPVAMMSGLRRGALRRAYALVFG